MRQGKYKEWTSVIWKPIRGFANYEVCADGLVRRSAPGAGARVGRVLTVSKRADGYCTVTLGRSSTTNYVHRLVADAFIGPCPDGMEVNHLDGDKSNNSVRNLEYATRAENAAHASRMGLTPTGDSHGSKTHPEMVPKGQSHGNAVLTDVEVVSIRRLRSRGVRLKAIAARFGIAEATVSSIAKGKSWSHIPMGVPC